MKNDFFLLVNEGEDTETYDNEITEDSEYYPIDNPENIENNNSCTVFYDEAFQEHCIEDIANAVIQSVEDSQEENDAEEVQESQTEETIEESEEVIEYVSSEQFQSFYDDFVSYSQFVNDTFSAVLSFCGLLCVILLLQWVLSITNSWRRNNR